MTLALHGKSKRRQVGLLTSALMAVMLAAIGGVLWLGTASASDDLCSATPCGNAPASGQHAVPLKVAQQGISFNDPDFLETGDCDAGPYTSGYVWHFVFVPGNGDGINFTARFHTAGDITQTTTGTPAGKHVYIQTATADKLIDGSGIASGTEGSTEVNLSHTCHPGADPATVTVNKTNNATNSQVLAGGTFDWIITLTVANGPTTSAYSFTDTAPSGMTFGTNSVTSEAEAGKLTCLSNTGSPVSCTLASGADTGNYVLTIHVTAPSSTAAADVCKGYTNSVINSQVTVDTDTVTVTGCAQVLTRQVKIKKVVTNVVNDPTTFAITRDGGTSVGNVSETTPLGPIDLDSQTHTFEETVTSGYSFVESFRLSGLDGNCEAPRDLLTAESFVIDTSVEVPSEGSWTVCFVNEKQAQVLGRKIRIGKVTTTATHPNQDFTGTIVPGGAPTSFSVNLPQNSLAGTPQDYAMASQVAQVVTETNLPAGWMLDGYNVSPDPNGTNQCSNTMSFSVAANANQVPAGAGTYLVCIKNSYTAPKGSIVVTKTTTLNGNPIPQERAGWHIHLTSAACSVNQTQDTDAAGKATFSNLPICNDYAVSEDTINAPFAGYTVVGTSTITGVAVVANQTTNVSFTNNRVFNPPQICQFGCTPLIVNTPTPTVAPPTPTPTIVPPTATPTKTPVEVVAGEKTPGAIATPLAPSTGSGFGDNRSSTNLFLALIGILSLSGGLALLGYARRAR